MLTKGKKKHHHHQFESKNPSFGHQKMLIWKKKKLFKNVFECTSIGNLVNVI